MRKLSIGLVSCLLGFSIIIQPFGQVYSFTYDKVYAQGVENNEIVQDPIYNGKIIYVTDNTVGNNRYSDLKTALDNASDGDIIQIEKGTVEDIGSGLIINKKVKIVGNGNEVAIRANATAKITIANDITLENINLSSRKESQRTFPIDVKSAYFKMNNVILTNGGIGEKFTLLINPVTNDDKIANITIEGDKSIDFDSIVIGESGHNLESKVNLNLANNVRSKNGLRIENYNSGTNKNPVIIDKSKITKYISENANNEVELVFDGNNKGGTVYLSKIRNVKLKDGARVTLQIDENMAHDIVETTFKLENGTTLNFSNLTNDITVRGIVADIGSNEGGIVEVPNNGKLTITENFIDTTKIQVIGADISSKFTMILPKPLEGNKKPDIVIFDGQTKIEVNDRTYIASVEETLLTIEERLGYVIAEGHEINVPRGASKQSILDIVNNLLHSSENIKYTGTINAISTNPEDVDTSVITESTSQSNDVELTFQDNNEPTTAKLNLKVKVVKNEQDLLREKIEEALKDYSFSYEQGTDNNTIQGKILEHINKVSGLENITMDLPNVNTEKVANKLSSEFVFHKDSINVSLNKEVEITSRNIKLNAPEESAKIEVANVDDLSKLSDEEKTKIQDKVKEVVKGENISDNSFTWENSNNTLKVTYESGNTSTVNVADWIKKSVDPSINNDEDKSVNDRLNLEINKISSPITVVEDTIENVIKNLKDDIIAKINDENTVISIDIKKIDGENIDAGTKVIAGENYKVNLRFSDKTKPEVVVSKENLDLKVIKDKSDEEDSGVVEHNKPDHDKKPFIPHNEDKNSYLESNSYKSEKNTKYHRESTAFGNKYVTKINEIKRNKRKILANPVLIKNFGFIDLDKAPWAKDAVDFVTSAGLFNGVGNNKFAPNENMNKGMISTLLYRLALSPDIEGNYFKDVKPYDYFAKASLWTVNKGIIKINNNIFDPHKEVTRAEIAKMLAHFVDVVGLDINEKDVKVDDLNGQDTETVAAINKIVRLGIMKGVGNNKFSPDTKVTRAQMAQILMNLMLMVNN